MKALDFSAHRLQLIGRENEMNALLKAYGRVKATGSSELILVRGAAGVGKSAILQKFYTESVALDPQVFFARGAILKEALANLCGLVLDADDMLRLCSKIEDAIIGQEEREAIIMFVPRIAEILGETNFACAQQHASVAKTCFPPEVDTTALLKPVLCRVMNGTCSRKHPVVLAIDGLHESDQRSIELIQALVSDAEIRHLIIVLSFRDTNFECIIKAGTKKGTMETDVYLGNLNEQEVIVFLSTFLDMELGLVTNLASVIYLKTCGNISDIYEFLRQIEEAQLIKFDSLTGRWTWETQRIQDEKSCSETMAHELVKKLGRLSERSKIVIKNAACLGLIVNTDVLEHVLSASEEILNPQGERHDVETRSNPYDGTISTLEVLNYFTSEGLFEKNSEFTYRFAHERILESAYAMLVGEGESARLHLRIGKLMWGRFSDGVGYAKDLFDVVNHLNRAKSIVTEPVRKLELAKLNLEAGELAMSMSAFLPAATFFQIGISLLSRNAWATHYELCLRLHSVSAEVEYCTGKFTPSSAMARAVLQHGRSLQDKTASYVTLVQSLVAQKKFAEAIELGFGVLEELGERVPKKIYQSRLLSELVQTKLALRKYSDDQLLSLPLLKEENKVASMTIINELSMGALYTAKGEWLLFLTLRMIRWTLERGICEEAACAFATYGALLCGPLNDVKDGVRMGKLAQTMLERFDKKDIQTRVQFWVFSCIHHWRAPLTESLDPLLTCYRTGMACGNINYALQGSAMYCSTYLWSGLPLVPIEADMRSFCSEMKNYTQESGLAYSLSTWQYVLNMMGKSNVPVELSGEAMDYTEILHDGLETNNRLGVAHVQLLRIMLAYHFGEIALAADICRAQSRSTPVFQALHEFVINEFFTGLVQLSQGKKTKSRSLRRAKKSIHQLKKWSTTSGNCLHMLALLQAEYMSITNKRQDEVKNAYSHAISLAVRSGFLQDSALANERAGLYFYACNDEDWASYYLTQAYSQYLDYGANAKAQSIQNQFHSLIAVPENRPNNTAHRGRRRYSGRSSSSHMRVSPAFLVLDSGTTGHRVSASSFASLRSTESTFSRALSSNSGVDRSFREKEDDEEDEDLFIRTVPINLIVT